MPAGNNFGFRVETFEGTFSGQKANCKKCRSYDPKLNPYGCAKDLEVTAWYGRLVVRLFGCEGFEQVVKKE